VAWRTFYTIINATLFLLFAQNNPITQNGYKVLITCLFLKEIINYVEDNKIFLKSLSTLVP